MGRISAAVNAGRPPSLGVSQDRAEALRKEQELKGGSPSSVVLPTEQISEQVVRTEQPRVEQRAQPTTQRDPVGSAIKRAGTLERAEQPLLQTDPETGEARVSDVAPSNLDPQEQARLHAEEQLRRGRPTWESVQTGIDEARQRDIQSGGLLSEDLESFSVDSMSNDLFNDDLSYGVDEPIIADLGDTESPFKFDIYSSKVNDVMNQEMQRPEFRAAADKLGITLEDGTVDPEAGAQLMYALSAQTVRRGISVDEELVQIEKEYEDSRKRNELDKKDARKRDAATRRDERILAAESRPEFDAFNAPKQALQMFKELRTPPQEGSFDSTTTPRPGFDLTDQEAADFMGTITSRLAESDISLLEATDYQDATTGKTYLGFKATPLMYGTIAGIQDQLRLANLSYEKDVSYIPNYRGLEQSQAALLHSQKGKTTGDFDVHAAVDSKGKPVVSTALDYLGTNANVVLDHALAGQVAIFEQVYADVLQQPQGSFERTFGISNHPMASLFQKDSSTFLKRIPNSRWESIDEVKREWEAADDFGRQELGEFFLYPAKELFDSAAASYAKPVMDGLRHRGRTIYYAQNLQGQSGRVMDGTTVLNMQSNKKSRGLVGSAVKHLVKGRSKQEIAEGKNRPQDRKARNFEAMVARSLLHDKASNVPTVEGQQRMFEENIGVWADVSEYLLDTTPKVDSIKEYAGNVTEYVQQKKVEGVSGKRLRPDNLREARDFPTTGTTYAKDSDPWVKKEVYYIAGVEHTRDIQTPYTHGEMRRKVAQVLDLQDSTGKPKGKQDEADVMFNTLLNLGRYLRGRPFHADLTVEVDGKNSSFAITSIQQGDRDLAEYSGVMWDPSKVLERDEITGEFYYKTYDLTSDDFETQSKLDLSDPRVSVVPVGDIRDLVQRTITPARGDGQTSILEQLYPDPEVRDRWRKAMGLIIKHGIIKDMHKKPAMTTGYGKAAGGHRSSIVGLLNDNPEFRKELFTTLNKDPNYDEQDVITELTKIEEAALKGSLGTNMTQTGVLKLVGNAGAVIGVDVMMRSPSGYPMHMAASKTRLSGPVQQRQTQAGGQYQVATFERATDPSQRVLGDFEQKQEAEATGKQTAYKMENRIGVNSIHGVDASIVHSTAANIKEINKGRKTPIWFRQVYDAFIVDIDSYDSVVDQANSSFIKNNRDWNIFTEAKASLSRVLDEVVTKAKEAKSTGGTFAVTPDGEYAEFYQALKNIDFVINTASKRGFIDSKLTKEQALQLKANLRKIGFDKEKGVQMNPDQFVFAFRNIFLAATGVVPALNHWENQSSHNKTGLIQDIVRQTNNYYGKDVASATPYQSVKQYS